MRYLLLTATFSITMIKLLGIFRLPQIPALAMANFQNINSSWKIYQKYIPPYRGAPEATKSSGTRGGSSASSECLLSQEENFPLLSPEDQMGLTLSEYPTFFIYIPPYKNAQ